MAYRMPYVARTPLRAGQPVYANGDGTISAQRHYEGSPNRGDTVTEADYLAHCRCRLDFCATAWARFVGKVPSPATLRYLRGRPGCRVIQERAREVAGSESAYRTTLGVITQHPANGLMTRREAADRLGLGWSDE